MASRIKLIEEKYLKLKSEFDEVWKKLMEKEKKFNELQLDVIKQQLNKKYFQFQMQNKGDNSLNYEKIKEKYKKLSEKCSQQTDEITNLELKLSSALAENVKFQK